MTEKAYRFFKFWLTIRLKDVRGISHELLHKEISTIFDRFIELEESKGVH